MKSAVKRLAAVAAVCAVAGSAVGSASAADSTLVSTIRAQSKAIATAPVVDKLKHTNPTDRRGAQKLIKAFGVLQHKLDGAATTVSKVRTNGSSERTAQQEWVKGVRGVSKGVGQLSGALRDTVNHKSAGVTKLQTALRTITTNGKLVRQADKQLGITHL